MGSKWVEMKPQIQQVWRLSLPGILTHITSTVMQYIDSAMVGALGANASASIGLVSSIEFIHCMNITIGCLLPPISTFYILISTSLHICISLQCLYSSISI